VRKLGWAATRGFSRALAWSDPCRWAHKRNVFPCGVLVLRQPDLVEHLDAAGADVELLSALQTRLGAPTRDARLLLLDDVDVDTIGKMRAVSWVLTNLLAAYQHLTILATSDRAITNGTFVGAFQVPWLPPLHAALPSHASSFKLASTRPCICTARAGSRCIKILQLSPLKSARLFVHLHHYTFTVRSCVIEVT
jgi:hypothetical protein